MPLTTSQQTALKEFTRFMYNPSKKEFILTSAGGMGKEMPYTTIVKTPTGDTTLGELSIGQEILGKNGKPTKILNIFPQGNKQVYKVTLRDKFSIECGANHLWRVHTKYQSENKNKYLTLTTEELMKKGLIKNNTKNEAKFNIPLCAAINYTIKKLPINPYVLGLAIGDGSNLGKVPVISIPDIDYENVLNLKKNIPNYITVIKDTFSNCPRYHLRHKKTRPNNLGKLFTELKLNVKSTQRFIPQIYKLGSINQRQELLQGLMDTDGSCIANRTTYSTLSPLLADDICELVQSLGGMAIKHQRNRGKKGIEFTINIRVNTNPFKLKRKGNNWKLPVNNKAKRGIIKIEKLGIKPQLCIQVDAKDSLFLVDHFIVTHNTYLIQHFIDELAVINKTNTLVGKLDKILHIVYGATTNQAAKIMAEHLNTDIVRTVHSLFSLKRGFKKDTGEEYFYKPKNKPIGIKPNTLLFIDEASYISDPLLKIIRDNLPANCKIVFIGDDKQLTPVNYSTSPALNIINTPYAELNEYVRFDNPELIELNIELRASVAENRLPKIKTNDSVFTLNKSNFTDLIIKTANNKSINFKVVAWTNNKVKYYSKLIHKEMYGDTVYNIGQNLIAKGTFKNNSGDLINSQRDLIITGNPTEMLQTVNNKPLTFIKLPTDAGTISIPESLPAAMKAIKEFKDNKEWSTWYGYKDYFATVINGYSITAHSSQASTFDIVFVDLQDIMRNKNFNEMLRLIYVASSRAKNKVIYLI